MPVIARLLFICLLSWRVVRLSLIEENYRSLSNKQSGQNYHQNSVRKFDNAPEIITLSSSPPLTFNITIGNPPQSFRILLDIGGTSFFVPSVKYQQGNNNISRYNHSASRTYEEDGEEFRDYVWDMKGFYARDEVCLMERCFNQTFIEASSMRLYEYAGMVDGVMGLDLRGRTEYSILSVINSLYYNFLISEQVISIWSDSDTNSPRKAKIFFGGVDPRLFIEPITWIPIEHHVGIKLDNIIIGELKYKTQDRQALILSVPGIYGPPELFLPINEKILGANCSKKPCFDIICEKIHTLPKIIFVFAGKRFALKPTDYINENKGNCSSRLIPFDGQYYLIGEPFINRYYTAFDIENRLIGFAENK